MQRLACLVAVLAVCGAAQVAHGQIVNGDFEAGTGSWNVVTPGFDEFASVPGGTYGGSSDKGYVVSSSDMFRSSMSDIRTALSTGGLPGWGAGSLTGDTHPGTLFFADTIPPDIASGTSIGGSVIYQDFMGSAGNKISFEYKFLSLERAPGADPTPPNVDFAFVSVQEVASGQVLAIHRLADTTGPHAFSAAPAAGTPINSSGVQTGFITELQSPLAAITLPGTTVDGLYRIAFGVIDVGGGFTPSGLMLDSVQLGVEPVMETASPPGGLAGDPVNLSFATVRVGAGGAPTQDFEIRNVSPDPVQPSTLLGTISGPTPGGQFSPVGPAITNFNLQRNTAQPESLTLTYEFTPTARGMHSATITVAGNDDDNPTDTVNLSGMAVGPVYNSTPVAPGGTIDMGVALNPGDMSTFTLDITNATTDGNLGGLTELNILGASFGGAFGGEFSFLSPITGGPLQPGDPAFQLSIKWTPTGPFNFQLHNAQLIVQTDVGAAPGQPGQQFTYNLQGQVGTLTSLPEPASFALWGVAGLAALAVARKVRRRR